MYAEDHDVLNSRHDQETHTTDTGNDNHVTPGGVVAPIANQPTPDDHGYPALSLEAIAPRADDILEAAKTLASAAKKLEKNRLEEVEAEQAARALQEEANDAFNARLEKRVTGDMRSFEDVQKDVLKALKKLDKAAESADEETEKSQAAYVELLSIITPSN